MNDPPGLLGGIDHGLRNLGCLGGAAIFIVIALLSDPQGAQSPATPSATVAAIDPARCDALIKRAWAAGLIREQPSAQRINVEDLLWAEFPASSKTGLALAVRCSAFRGAPGEFDSSEVYGYRSGRRLAMATSVGVKFE